MRYETNYRSLDMTAQDHGGGQGALRAKGRTEPKDVYLRLEFRTHSMGMRGVFLSNGGMSDMVVACAHQEAGSEAVDARQPTNVLFN